MILILAGPLMIFWAKRTRDIFRVVRLGDLFFYASSFMMTEYPGGLAAQFRPPVLWYTVAEVGILLLLALIVSAIVAAVHWVYRKLRPVRAEADDQERASATESR